MPSNSEEDDDDDSPGTYIETVEIIIYVSIEYIVVGRPNRMDSIAHGIEKDTPINQTEKDDMTAHR